MSSLWKQKAEQRDDARDAQIIAEGVARRAAAAAAEAAKTPAQKAEEAQAKIDSAWCQHTEEHARSPAFYAAEEKRWKRLYAEWDEARRIREGGHPKVDLSKDFPSLGGAGAGAGGKK
jgi:hypothetical protein